jgi:imidazolonepropionase-like amidohydrolase
VSEGTVFLRLISIFLLFANFALSQAVAIRAARLIDGKNDRVITKPVVVVEGGKIQAVGADLAVPKGATVIDLGNLTLLPGLIDAHTHLLSEMDGTNLMRQDLEMLKIVATQSTAERALLGARLGNEDLLAGITTVRDLGNSGVNGDVALRDAIDRGWVPGPRIVASTRALAAPGGQFGRLTPAAQKIIDDEYVVINGAQSAWQAVRQALYDGANCIKVIVNGNPANVSQEEMNAIVGEAHRARAKVAAHAIGDQATRTAAEAGVDSIEHAYVVPDDVLKMMAEKHIYLVPTDGTPHQFEQMMFGGHQVDSEERKRALAPLKDYLTGAQNRLQRARKMGVPIAAGSDMYLTVSGKTRGQASLDMLEAYSAAGMPAMDIIRAATSNAAELLGLQDRVGTLEPGKFADIIGVVGDPLTEITVAQRARFVMKGGVVVKNER